MSVDKACGTAHRGKVIVDMFLSCSVEIISVYCCYMLMQKNVVDIWDDWNCLFVHVYDEILC
jgi:hypothetical protein